MCFLARTVFFKLRRWGLPGAPGEPPGPRGPPQRHGELPMIMGRYDGRGGGPGRSAEGIQHKRFVKIKVPANILVTNAQHLALLLLLILLTTYYLLPTTHYLLPTT